MVLGICSIHIAYLAIGYRLLPEFYPAYFRVESIPLEVCSSTASGNDEPVGAGMLLYVYLCLQTMNLVE